VRPLVLPSQANTLHHSAMMDNMEHRESDCQLKPIRSYRNLLQFHPAHQKSQMGMNLASTAMHSLHGTVCV